MGDIGRLHPNIVISREVANQSYRTNGSRIELIVLHDTESHNRPPNLDLAATGEWFNNPAADAKASADPDNVMTSRGMNSTPTLANSALNVVATETESNTASTATRP